MPVLFDTTAPMQRLLAIIAGLDGMQAATIGVPEAWANRVSAYVVQGPQTLSDKAAGLLECELSYVVVFGYRVAHAEASAELTIASLNDQFKYAWAVDRRLGGTVDTSHLDYSLGTTPEYGPVAGQEFRQYPINVIAVQRAPVPVAP